MRVERCVMGGVVCLATLFASGCGEKVPELELASPDLATFETEVYPVLLRDCGAHLCHSSHERFFQVFGPGRDRLSEDTQPIDPVLQAEVAFTYNRARSMINVDEPEKSLLLRKPLAVDAGGTGHEGVDVLGRDVYPDEEAPGYVVLHAWVTASVASPDAGATSMLPVPRSQAMTSP